MDEKEPSNILTLDIGRERRKDRPPPLSDEEILRLRALLDNADRITAACPVARRAVEGD